VSRFKRPDGRANDALRPIKIEVGVSKFAEGSARISFGDTQVLCLATLQESVPRHLEGKGTGWVTAEYAMLPRSTPERSQRESIAGRPGGRTFEIQRLVGRALRTAMDLKALGPRSVIVDCEVIQGDGGTRTAAITGGYVALAHAVRKITPSPLLGNVAAVSAGFVRGELMLDLAYAEDSIADADVNVVANSDGQLIEVQGTAEGRPFSKDDFDKVLELSLKYRELLAGLDLELITPSDLDTPIAEPEETGRTFAENASHKARTYAAASGLRTVADDSGLEVDALHGAPGLRSRRFFGEDASAAERNTRLLALLEGVEARGARFVCVTALASPDGRVELFDGEVRGEIAHAPRGEAGFGYDPLFVIAGDGRTMAELPSEEKHRISHRGLAAAKLRAYISGEPR
jgi:ribonuclease PH